MFGEMKLIVVSLFKMAHNTGLAKVAVQCSADTFVVKIATFAKPETVVRQCKKTADPQMAHLVFADTRANAEKPKEPFFANAPNDDNGH